MKRLPNGYGGVTKLSGNRSKPYMAWIPHKRIIAGRILNSYYEDVKELEEYVNGKEFKNTEFEKDVRNLINKYSADSLEVKRKKIPIGYYETREEALLSLAEYNKTPIDGELKNLTFAQIWMIVRSELSKKVQASTLAHYDGSFKHCANIHNKKITAIKTVDMQRCIDYVAETYPAVQGKVIMICNYVFKYAMEQDIVQKNYAEFLKTKSYDADEGVPFAKEEIQKILDNRDWRYKTKNKSITTGFDMPRAVIILLYTGMRIGELLNVKMEHIHLDERYIEVQGTKTENAVRITPIHEDIVDLLYSDGEHLICDNKNAPVKYATFEKSIWKKYCADLGFDHKVHDTRHTFITLAQECGISPVMLRKMVGHSTKKFDITDNVYTHPYIESLVKEISKFSVT